MNQQQQQKWNPSYWQTEKHGKAWDRVKESLKRDWEQTKADVSMGGKELNQQVSDTVKQATGKEAIPGPNTPNTKKPSWQEVEDAFRYGYGAHQQYLDVEWDEKFENKLANEWDPDKTGKSFKDVQQYVRRGWEYKA